MSSESTRAASTAAALAWATLLCGIVACSLFVLTHNTVVPASWGVAAGARNDVTNWVNKLLQAVMLPVTYAAMAVLIVRRQPGNLIAWLLLMTGLGSAVQAVASEWAVYGYYTVPTVLPLTLVAAWCANWIWVLIYTLLLLTVALFPAGHLLSKPWRWLIGLPLALFYGCLTVAGAVETPMSSAYGIPNPFVADNPAALYNLLFSIGVPMMPLSAVIVLAQVVVRFRRAHGIERQQFKWLLAGVALLVIMVSGGLWLGLVLDMRIGDVLVNASVLAPALGIGVALLRYRLYDIDVIINRTLVYGSSTALLALVYLGSIIVLQRIFTAATGQQSDLAIVISTLVIAALFNPLRLRLQTLIDRRFYRRRYNAEKALQAFAAAARDEVDVGALRGELENVIRRTVQPTNLSVWLNTEGER